ncbi:MAG: TIGR01777 family oxidoreductase [Planctomycetota bacterium]
MRILITGGTGFVGKHMVGRLLDRGDQVVISSRSEAKVKKVYGGRVEALEWDPMSGPAPIENIDAVINLMGENVGKGRWTRAKKQRIRDSRIIGTRNLVAGMAAAKSKPKVLVSASAIGFYGPTGHNIAHEGSTGADGDFLADVCREWESEAIVARGAGIRTPIVRIGVILGREDGAYPQLRRIFKLFLGGTIGLGKAWFSWVHVDDVVGVFLHCLDDEEALDVYNATAPNPVSNYEFTHEMARSLKRPVSAPVPPQALRVVQGEFANYVTMSQRIKPLRTIGIGYEFKFPDVRKALEALAAFPA